MHSEDDLRNVHNPNKKPNFWPSSSEDIRHDGRNGFVQDEKKAAAKDAKKAEKKEEKKEAKKDDAKKPPKKDAKKADSKKSSKKGKDASKIGCQFKTGDE